MGGRRRIAFAAVALAFGTGQMGRTATPKTQVCRVAVIEGTADAGEAFERPLGNGLRVLLEPIASGWILRVLPARGPRGQHDYAELATPPYHSVSPLLVGTDFSFRAQDAIAWNPRHFHFAAGRSSFAALSDAYEQEMSLLRAGPTPSEASREASLRAAETRLARLVSETPEAEFSIVDARLVQGSADQAQTAAMVASHLNRSAHEVDQQPGSRSSPLGRIEWLRFRIRFDLPQDFRPDPRLAIERSACL